MKKFYLATVSLLIAVSVFSQPCTKLFFSEYVEGSSNNKAIEIYNPTQTPVDLTGYKVLLFTNGATTPTNTLNLSGIVNAGGVFVIANSSANDTIKAYTDTTSSVANFNGDDAIALLNGTDTLDIIGVIGIDPGTFWAVDSGSTLDRTLVRKATVQQGTTDWAFSSTQWNGLARDTIRLGAHTMDPCGAITDTLVSFSSSTATVSEGAGTYNISISLNTVSATDTFLVDVELTGGTGDASDIGSYTTQTVTFNPNTASVSLPVTITDDTIQEPSETLVFKLRNAANGLLLSSDSVFTLTIGASDAVIVLDTVALSEITSVDTSFRPDSLGKVVFVTATVYGINNRSAGLQFTIHDATDGIGVFSTSSNFGYTVTEGDLVAVKGTVEFFSGITQLGSLDTIYKIGTGTLLAPVVTPDLDESTESELVRLNNVHLVTPSQWDTTAHSSGFSCDITDGVGNWILRIDEQTNIFKTNMAAPAGNFHVIGIGGQFDGSAPYNSGYQLLPRYSQDIIQINSLDDLANNIARIYPNPNNGNFTIELNSEATAEVKLFDFAGKLVYTSQINSKVVRIETDELNAGIYLMEVKADKQIQRNKINILK